MSKVIDLSCDEDIDYDELLNEVLAREGKPTVPSRLKKRTKRVKVEKKSNRVRKRRRTTTQGRSLNTEMNAKRVAQEISMNQSSPTILSQLQQGDFDKENADPMSEPTVPDTINANQLDVVPRGVRASAYEEYSAVLKKLMKLYRRGQLCYPLEDPEYYVTSEQKVESYLFPRMLLHSMTILRTMLSKCDSQEFFNETGFDMDFFINQLDYLRKTRLETDTTPYKRFLGKFYRLSS